MSRIDLALAIAHADVYMETGDSASSRALTVSEFRTLALASLGGALEFYDFVIFVFFTGVVGELFFSAGLPDWMRQLQTFGIFAAGYLARPLGGVVMAHFGDIHAEPLIRSHGYERCPYCHQFRRELGNSSNPLDIGTRKCLSTGRCGQ
jgi:MFS family permease